MWKVMGMVLAVACVGGVGRASTASGVEPGTAYCFGVACPCGNDDLAAGCRNSTGAGARLWASGTTSLGANDLRFHVAGAPRSANGTFYMGSEPLVLAVGDGLRCAGGQTHRFPGHENSGQTGTFEWGDLRHQTPPGLLAPGTTWHFQAWYRDVPGALCGVAPRANLSNGYQVTFTP